MAHIGANQASGFIQPSSSPTAAPILFANKKDGWLRLCVDYRALNLAMVKNWYPLRLISEILDCVRYARIFSKLDLRSAYKVICMEEGDKYKTAFRTSYGQFGYRDMPIGLTNTPATVLSYITDCLRPYIDDFAVCSLDDILLYLTNEKEQEEHVHQVLQRPRELGLYCKAEKCQFGISEVGFLSFVIPADEVAMESDRISTLGDWPTPDSGSNVQVLPAFTNVYPRFIRKQSQSDSSTHRINKEITDIEPQEIGMLGLIGVDWGSRLRFRKLTRTFPEAPNRQHFDPATTMIFQTDTSGFAIKGILNHHDVCEVLTPVNFYSPKCPPDDQNSDTYDPKLLAILETVTLWQYYLYGTNYRVFIWCDHKNLEYFQISKVLTTRQARWLEIVSAYNFDIEHQEASKNPADGPPRWPDSEIGSVRLLARLSATVSVDQYEQLMRGLIAAPASDPLAVDV